MCENQNFAKCFDVVRWHLEVVHLAIVNGNEKVAISRICFLEGYCTGVKDILEQSDGGDGAEAQRFSGPAI